MKNQNESYKYMILNSMTHWAYACLIQGEALLIQSNEMHMDFSKKNIHNIHSQMKKMQIFKMMNEDFFVLSCYHFYDCIKAAIDSMSGFRAVFEKIDKVIPYNTVKDIRDMRVHFIDYYKGSGKKQEEYMKTGEIGNTGITFMSDASSTIVVDNKYLIGGVLDVVAFMQIIKDMLPDIEKLCDKHIEDFHKKMDISQKST